MSPNSFIQMATAMVEDSNFEDDQLASMTTDDIIRASRLLDNEIRILKVPYSSYHSFPVMCLYYNSVCMYVCMYYIWRVLIF